MNPRGIPLTLEQRENMMHALGSSHGSIGWRNYFCAGGASIKEWDELVSLGVAERGERFSHGTTFFKVTGDGIKALGYDPDILQHPIKLPKPKRSK